MSYPGGVNGAAFFIYTVVGLLVVVAGGLVYFIAF